MTHLIASFDTSKAALLFQSTLFGRTAALAKIILAKGVRNDQFQKSGRWNCSKPQIWTCLLPCKAASNQTLIMICLQPLVAFQGNLLVPVDLKPECHVSDLLFHAAQRSHVMVDNVVATMLYQLLCRIHNVLG
ncbi:hypothetical protein BJ742DRAFT_745639 [Cladochytrium replicatum]|nr:hypothetical protein BJ742DRAFT_745639 [Cladochytrium replicatum]